MNSPRRIALIATGGTIEKTYDELGGVLSNRVSNLDVMLPHLELGGIELSRVALMNKDSLDMTQEDLDLVVATVRHRVRDHDGVVVVHGTDRLADTGVLLHEALGTPRAGRADGRHAALRAPAHGCHAEPDGGPARGAGPRARRLVRHAQPGAAIPGVVKDRSAMTFVEDPGEQSSMEAS